MSPDPRLIVHIIYRLGIGGLENGLVNLINKLPENQYRHAIVCLTESTDFSKRIQRQDVEIYQIHKRPGQDWQSFYRVYRLLKSLRPAIVHTRNLATIEYQFCALFAGVPYRLHGEHGWDVFDPEGANVRYRWVRRIAGYAIHGFVPLSQHIQDYLVEKVGIPPSKISRICNGVDTGVFFPRSAIERKVAGCPQDLAGKVLIGTVGRMHGVKDQLTLARAFIEACRQSADFAKRCRLWLIGEGPLKREAESLLVANALAGCAWLPGERNDIADLLRCLDIFVLPSTAEGISNTILEAMACGLPVIATRVGGNPELVADGRTGILVDAQDVAAMSAALLDLTADDAKRRQLGTAALQRIHREFSIDKMVARYQQLYDRHS